MVASDSFAPRIPSTQPPPLARKSVASAGCAGGRWGVRIIADNCAELRQSCSHLRLEVADELGVAEDEAVVDVVREVVQRARRRLLLGRVAARAVVLGPVRDHHLRVALGAERAALEQRLAEEDAARVDVESRLDVVQGVDDDVQALPEVVVEGALGRRRDAVLERRGVELRVHLRHRLDRRARLRVADVVVAEEELAGEVRLLDDVVVGDGELAARPARDAHQREVLEELAAERARSDEEDVERRQLLDERRAEDGGLRGVAPGGAEGGGREVGGRRRLGRQALERVEVEALRRRVELPRHRLHHLLADDAADDRRHRRERRDGAHRQVLDDRRARRLVELRHLGVGVGGGVELIREGEDLVGGRRVGRRRQRAAVGGAVRIEGAEGEVEEAGAPEARVGSGGAHHGEERLGEGGGRACHLRLVDLPQLARRVEEVVEGLERERLRLAHLGDQPARPVVVEGGAGRQRQREALLALRAVLDLERRAAVERLHPLQLGEGHVVAVVEIQRLVVDALHAELGAVGARALDGDRLENRRLDRLARRVVADE